MFFHAHSLRLVYSMPIQNQFAKPPLRGFPFAHVWLLAIYMLRNMCLHASMSHIFVGICMVLNRLNIIHFLSAGLPLLKTFLQISQRQVLKNLIQPVIDSIHNVFLYGLRNPGCAFFCLCLFVIQIIRSFQCLYDGGHCNTGRRIFQQISTLGAFDALHNPCPAQAGKHLLQILGRDLISLSNTSECHMTIFRIDCQINESRHSVSAFFRKFHSLLYCLECLIQVLNNIVDILGTNGKTDGRWCNSLICKFFF